MLVRFDGGSSRQISDIVTGNKTWICQFEPKYKQQSRVWILPDKDPPTKAKQPWGMCQQENGGDFLWKNWWWLPESFSKPQKQQPRTGQRVIMLHHDNAPTQSQQHSSVPVLNSWLKRLNSLLIHFTVLTWPPYDPFLFPTLKDSACGKGFPNPEQAVHVYKSTVAALRENERKECFQKWFAKMQECIECQWWVFW